MGQTTNKQFPYPDGSSNPNIPGDFQSLAQAIDDSFNLDGLVGVELSTPVQTNQILRYDGTNWTNATGGTGTVTSVSLSSTNGFSGSIANSTSTPTITLTTSISGVLKGSSNALAAATSNDITTLIGTTTLGSTTLTLGGTTTTIAGLTLSSPALDTPSLTLSTTTSTSNGRVAWDATNDKLLIGDGSATLVEFASSTIIPTARSLSSNNYTLVSGDKDRLIEINNTGTTAITVTVPTDTTTFPIGSQVHILRAGTGTGTFTITPASGVTINGTPGLRLRAQWSSATLIKRASNLWVALGDLSA